MSLLVFKNVGKTYKNDLNYFEALKNINLSFEQKDFVAIIGPSGCGKSTLINLILGIHDITKGEILYQGKTVSKFSKRKWEYLRKYEFGVLFQDYNLINDLTIAQNIDLLLNDSLDEKIKKVLIKLDLTNRGNSLISKLSGGQKQRGGLARAIINNPKIIICDEPTGALDSINSVIVMKLLKNMSNKSLVICVSHDLDLISKYANRIITLDDGQVISDYRNEDIIPQKIKENIIKYQGLSLRKKLVYCNRQVIKRKGRFLIACIACSLALIFIALTLGVSKGANNYFLNEFNHSFDSTIIDLVSYQNDNGLVKEKRISEDILDKLSNTNKYIIRENLNNFFEQAMAKSLKYHNQNSIITLNNYSIKCGGNNYSSDNLLYGRMPYKFNEIIVNEAFINVLKENDKNDKKAIDYLNTVLYVDKKLDLNKYSHDFKHQFSIVGISKDSLFAQTSKIFLDYSKSYEYLINTKMNELSLYQLIDLFDYQIQVNNPNEIIHVIKYLKSSNYYVDKNNVDNNYNFSLIYNDAVNDLMMFNNLIESSNIILYIFLSLSAFISIILTSNVLISFINQQLRDLAILKVIGVSSLDLFSIPIIISFYLAFSMLGLTFLVTYSMEIFINPVINTMLKTTGIRIIDIYSSIKIPLIIFFSALAISLLSAVYPLISLTRRNLGDILKGE